MISSCESSKFASKNWSPLSLLVSSSLPLSATWGISNDSKCESKSAKLSVGNVAHDSISLLVVVTCCCVALLALLPHGLSPSTCCWALDHKSCDATWLKSALWRSSSLSSSSSSLFSSSGESGLALVDCSFSWLSNVNGKLFWSPSSFHNLLLSSSLISKMLKFLLQT